MSTDDDESLTDDEFLAKYGHHVLSNSALLWMKKSLELRIANGEAEKIFYGKTVEKMLKRVNEMITERKQSSGGDDNPAGLPV